MNDYQSDTTDSKPKFSLRYPEILLYLGLFFIGVLIAIFIEYLLTPIQSFAPISYKFLLVLSNIIPLLLPIFVGFFIAKKNETPLLINFKPNWVLIPVLGFISIFMGLFCSYTTEFVPHDSGFLKKLYHEYETAFESIAHPAWLLVLATCILAPIVEEVFFRGLLLNGLLKHAKTETQVWAAIICTAFLFGLIHMNPWQFIAALIAGIVMGYVYYRTQSLGNTIIIHALNNIFSVVVMLYYNKMEPAELTDYPEYWNLFFLGFIILGLWFVYQFTKPKKITV